MSKTTKTILVIVIVLVVGGLIYWAMSQGNSSQTSSTYGTNMQSSSTPTASSSGSGQTLADAGLAPYAYEITSGKDSASTTRALSGFSVTKTKNADGSFTVALTAHKAGYINQTYTVQSGEKLYFIEKVLTDDSETSDTDAFPGDDSAVLVDVNGFIVQQ